MKMKPLFRSIALTVLVSTVAFNASAKGYVDDATTTASAMSVLTAAKNLPATDIKVTTYKGTVQLSGFVDNKEQAKRAEQLVKKADGTAKVINNLLVKTKPQNAAAQYAKDAAITTKVKAKLATTSDVSATDIGVNTYNGVVQLSGFVDSQQAITKASELVKDTDGVSNVVNNLVLKDKTDTDKR
jgi:hyperosmotically inducible protein